MHRSGVRTSYEKVDRNCAHQFFFSRKGQGYVSETGKPEIAGYLLRSCDSDGAGSTRRNAEECGIPGIFPEKAGGRPE